ncbi:MAG: hypothetical protein WKF59_08755 [Chitinophagaceae bacterium]
MKTSRNQENKQSKQGLTNKPIPEIRDNMDSRHNSEQNKNNTGKANKRGIKKEKNKL